MVFATVAKRSPRKSLRSLVVTTVFTALEFKTEDATAWKNYLPVFRRVPKICSRIPQPWAHGQEVDKNKKERMRKLPLQQVLDLSQACIPRDPLVDRVVCHRSLGRRRTVVLRSVSHSNEGMWIEHLTKFQITCDTSTKHFNLFWCPQQAPSHRNTYTASRERNGSQNGDHG